MRSILSKQTEGTSRLPALVLHNPFTFSTLVLLFIWLTDAASVVEIAGEQKEGTFEMKRLDDERSKCTTIGARLLVGLIDFRGNQLTFKLAHFFRLEKSFRLYFKAPTDITFETHKLCLPKYESALFVPVSISRKIITSKRWTNESFCFSAKLSSVEICVSHRTWYRSRSACMKFQTVLDINFSGFCCLFYLSRIEDSSLRFQSFWSAIEAMQKRSLLSLRSLARSVLDANLRDDGKEISSELLRWAATKKNCASGENKNVNWKNQFKRHRAWSVCCFGFISSIIKKSDRRSIQNYVAIAICLQTKRCADSC